MASINYHLPEVKYALLFVKDTKLFTITMEDKDGCELSMYFYGLEQAEKFAKDVATVISDARTAPIEEDSITVRLAP